MPQSYELKPSKKVFVNYRFLMGTLFSFFFWLIVGVVLFVVYPLLSLLPVILFIVFAFWRYYVLGVRYRKERYIFYPDKIVRKGGGIFSDAEQELTIKNITNVTLRLPFLQYKLFGTGALNIRSAGSGFSSMYLGPLENSKQMYEYVQKVMKSAGFSLTQKTLVQEEQPSTIGIIFEIAQIFVSIFFFVLIFGINVVVVLIAVLSEYALLFLLGFLIVIGLVVMFGIFRFLDLKRRTYRVYTDAITYNEGFLTKNYSIIPIENLADSESTQTLVDRVFGLYDVKISCQGSGQEVTFKNMANGKALEENIDRLIAQKKSLPKTRARSTSQATASTRSVAAKKASSQRLSMDSRFSANLKMDMKRTIVPYLIALPFCLILFPLMLPWIFIFVGALISVYATAYSIKPNSMEQKYDFINKTAKEFTNDKITGVVFSEGIIDRWFKTCSINFWSIGSSADITFKNIKKTSDLYERVLAKVGLTNREVLYETKSDFSLLRFIVSDFSFLILPVFVCIPFLVMGFLIHWIFFLAIIIALVSMVVQIVYKHYFFAQSKLTLFKDFAHYKKGLFNKQYFYSSYESIKDITIVRYPFIHHGYIRFNVAGERMVGQGKNQMMVSNSFTIPYVAEIETKDDLIDLIFYQRPNAKQVAYMEQNMQKYSPKTLLSAKPALANALFGLVMSFIPLVFIGIFLMAINPYAVGLLFGSALGMLIVAAIIAFFVLVFVFAIVSVRAKTYFVQNFRVVYRWGIFRKKQISIVYSKIDHMNTYQGALNKMFKNGSITVNTAGSSSPELTIKNISSFKQFYDLLNKNY